MYSYSPYYENYLAHYGVLGMKWGIRRYQPYTKGQKGVFKGLKKDYKQQKKVLKAERKYYQSQGDELASVNISEQLKALKKSYKKSVNSITKEFNKENWEAYKEKIANTGSMKEVDAIKKELTGEQLWKANERFKAQNEFEKTKYGFNEKMEKLNQVANTVNAAANLGRAGLAVADVVQTYGNMNRSDMDYKPLSKEANANAAAQRAATLKDVRDRSRMPGFTGVRESSDLYKSTSSKDFGKGFFTGNSDSGKSNADNISKNISKADLSSSKGSKNDFSYSTSSKTFDLKDFTTPKNGSSTSKKDSRNVSNGSSNSSIKDRSYDSIKESIFGKESKSDKTSTNNPTIKAAINYKIDLSTPAKKVTNNFNANAWSWDNEVPSKYLKVKVGTLRGVKSTIVPTSYANVAYTADVHKRYYNT